MADYIYLMQNRLTPAQWRAVEAVRESARAHNMPVFLVGGTVRDLTSGSPVRDLDFAVQGDPGALRQELEGRSGVVAGENSTLSSLYFTFRGGVRAEIGPTLTVSYPEPGRPETQPAAILDDLRRRDFTANAMAISLNEGSYGLLLDPLNGTADIENRQFRLVSPYGFIEQPALLLRAARLSERLGWVLEERTRTRYETSKEENSIARLSDADRGYELEEIFHEEDPPGALAHLEEEGWRDALLPSLRLSEGDRGSLDEVRELIGQLETQGLHPDPSAVFFPLVTSKLSGESRAALKAMFPRQGFVRQIETLEARSKELAGQLSAKAASAPSEAWRILMDADPEVVLYLALHTRAGAVANKIKAFLREWPQMRQKIPYGVMQEMRITPDLPGYDKLLDDLFFALIDGKLETVEATRAFLEPYSPPAPPQVAVRRRAAKSTRSRSKRAVEETPDEPVEDVGEDDADDTELETEGSGKTPAEDAAEEEPAPEQAAAKAEKVTPSAPEKTAQDGATDDSELTKPAQSGAKAKKPAKEPAENARQSTPVRAEAAGEPRGAKAAGKAAAGTKPAHGSAKANAAASDKKGTAVKAAAKISSTPARKGAVSTRKAAPPAKTAAKAAAKRDAGKAAPAGRSSRPGATKSMPKGKPAAAVKSAPKKAAPAKAKAKAAPSKSVKKAPAKAKKSAAPARPTKTAKKAAKGRGR